MSAARTSFGRNGSLAIVGVGRWGMSDDSAGLEAAHALRERFSSVGDEVTIVDDESPCGAAAVVVEAMPKTLLILDAAMADARHPVGTFVVLSWPAMEGVRLRSEGRALSTHSFGIRHLLEVVASLAGRTPNVTVYAIFGESFERGFEMSVATRKCIDRVVQAIERDLRRHGREAPSCTS